jgi:ubiquinone/menaquinone biosynthesis C-methylase UbiE
MDTDTASPNHHAGSRHLTGVTGLLAGLTMAVGRSGVARLAADLAGVTPGDHVVAVGCGPGAAAREAAGRGARVTGVDPATVMLRLARALTSGRPAVTWCEGRAEALPVGDRAATVVWSLSTVHHWDDIDIGLAEAHRVLAPRGRLLAVERRIRPGARGHAGHGWTDAQAETFGARCASAGFVDVEVGLHAVRRRRLLVVQAIRP